MEKKTLNRIATVAYEAGLGGKSLSDLRKMLPSNITPHARALAARQYRIGAKHKKRP